MIRPATVNDVPRIIQMGALFWAQTLYAAHVPYSESSMMMSCRDMLSHSYSAGMPLLWVATDEAGVVIGALGLTCGPMYANLDAVVASELFWYVEEEHRKTGVGIGLLKAVQEAAASAKIDFLSMMFLSGAGDPQRAADIYRKSGFQQAETTFMKRLSWPPSPEQSSPAPL